MQVAEGCRYQALTAVLLEPLQSAYVRATAVSHVRGADTPSRRVVAQEGSSRSQSARSSGYTASCTEILQCSGVAATVLTANPPDCVPPLTIDGQTDRQESDRPEMTLHTQKRNVESCA